MAQLRTKGLSSSNPRNGHFGHRPLVNGPGAWDIFSEDFLSCAKINYDNPIKLNCLNEGMTYTCTVEYILNGVLPVGDDYKLGDEVAIPTPPDVEGEAPSGAQPKANWIAAKKKLFFFEQANDAIRLNLKKYSFRDAFVLSNHEVFEKNVFDTWKYLKSFFSRETPGGVRVSLMSLRMTNPPMNVSIEKACEVISRKVEDVNKVARKAFPDDDVDFIGREYVPYTNFWIGKISVKVLFVKVV